jgi:ssDNA-binding Zn-finger/Zn-ribbon topoisomerase 1
MLKVTGRKVPYGDKEVELSSIPRVFRCAECGHALVVKPGEGNNEWLIICGRDEAHSGIVHESVLHKTAARAKEFELEGRIAAQRDLMAVTRKHYPQIATALERRREEATRLLYPREVEI